VNWQCYDSVVKHAAAPPSNDEPNRTLSKAGPRARPTIEDLQQHAAKRGGRCLASEYVDCKAKMRWRCANGHEWLSHWNSVQYHWCPKCAKIQKLELNEFVRIARWRGGKLLSKEYINSATRMLWQCKLGHTWWAKPSSVKGDSKYHAGTWCRTCARLAQRGRRHPKVTLEQMREIARERHGECLSEVYVNAHTKMKWRCGRGHEWMANRTTIKKSWCPRCVKLLEFEQVEATASDHGGKVLSPRSDSIDGATVLLWQCVVGHQWRDTVLRVRQGAWCKRCNTARYWNLQDMPEIASRHAGVCLSKRYRGYDEFIRWRCAEGHVFKLTPHTVTVSQKAGRPRWCPICDRR
jgi:hypothetical protein